MRRCFAGPRTLVGASRDRFKRRHYARDGELGPRASNDHRLEDCSRGSTSEVSTGREAIDQGTRSREGERLVLDADNQAIAMGHLTAASLPPSTDLRMGSDESSRYCTAHPAFVPLKSNKASPLDPRSRRCTHVKGYLAERPSAENHRLCTLRNNR